jgi:hypothetical protein
MSRRLLFIILRLAMATLALTDLRLDQRSFTQPPRVLFTQRLRRWSFIVPLYTLLRQR